MGGLHEKVFGPDHQSADLAADLSQNKLTFRDAALLITSFGVIVVLFVVLVTAYFIASALRHIFGGDNPIRHDVSPGFSPCTRSEDHHGVEPSSPSDDGGARPALQ